jgi:hypothetical protein
MVKERKRAMSAVNYGRRQILPSKVIWDGNIDHFEVLGNNDEVNYRKIAADNLIYSGLR